MLTMLKMDINTFFALGNTCEEMHENEGSEGISSGRPLARVISAEASHWTSDLNSYRALDAIFF